MKTLTTPEAKSNKTTQFFTALALAGLMVTAAGSGAAYMIYHEFSSMPENAQATVPRGLQTERLVSFAADSAPMQVDATAESGSDYRRVDNTVLPPAAARRVIAAWKSNPVVSNVPPPLTPASSEVANTDTDDRPPATDSQSKYIVSAQTGRVIGIDGSAGAAAEAARPQPVPVAVAVQMPPPEIRVAAAVQVRAALPVVPGTEDADLTQAPAATDGAQYVPVRRAQPVMAGHSFDAASYLAAEDTRPVARAQAINPTSRQTGFGRSF